MSTTIDSLDIQISTSAGNSSANIEALASALEKLKNNSKLTTVTNNLNKLATVLTNLNHSMRSLNGVGRLEKLATALSGLNGIQKLSGLNSALNTLKKLPTIIDSLDAATLEKFAKQMDKLADALGPLAMRITTVANGFSRLPSRISSAVTATNRMTSSTNSMSEAVNTASLNMFTMMSNAEQVVQYLNMVTDALASAISRAMEWDGIQYRFGRAFGEDAEETYQYILKVNEALGVNVQEFMQYSSMYGSLLSGFGLSQDKVTTISIGLSELTYDLWAANNDVVKRYEDVATAVKSAITGEIEPIRNLGIAMTEASLQEFIDSTHLAGISIEKLSEAQKAEVRYAAMVNGAMNQGIVGTYAREMHTAEGAVRSLSQSFKTLVQAFGSLFIPILQVAIPYVTAFVEVLTDAVRWVAKLFGIELFKIDWSSSNKGISGLAEGADDTATGLGKATKAAKKLRDYTMGFDELNVINPDSGNSGTGGKSGTKDASDWGSGLNLDTLWDDSVFAQASKRVDEIKAKILDFFDTWKWVFAALGTVMLGFTAHKAWKFFKNSAIGVKLIGGIKKVLGTFKDFIFFLKEGFKFTEVFKAQFPKLSGAISKVLSPITKLSSFLKLPVWSTFLGVVTAIVSVAYFLYENWDKVVNVVKEFFKENIVPKLKEIEKHLDDTKKALEPLGDLFEFIKDNVLPGVADAFEIVGGIIFGAVGGVIAAAFNILVGLVENAIQIISGIVETVSGVIELIVDILMLGDIEESWSKTWNGVKDIIDGAIGLIFDPIKDLVDGIIDWFVDLWDELVGHSIVPDMINAIVEWFEGLPSRVLSPVREFVNSVTKKFKDMWTNIKTWFSTYVAPKFTKVYWENKFNVIKNAVSTKLNETKKVVTDKWAILKSWFNTYVATKFTKAHWENKFNVIKSAVTTKLHEAKKAVTDSWANIKNWFNTYVAPKFTKTHWANKFDVIRSAITTKLHEAKKAVTDAWANVKTWFNTYVTSKFTKDYWANKFDVIRSAITTKLYEAKKAILDQWSVVRTWFSTSVAPKFTKVYWSNLFDSIRSSIASKLSDAWKVVSDFFSVSKWKKKVVDAIAEIKNNFKMPSFPSIKLKVTWDTNVGKVKTALYKALGLDGFPRLSWSTYATGGFPSMGEMFIAREAGPELVGRIGSKSTVANNDQIVTAVSQGVYDAVRAAMGGNNNGGSQNINVYLDGKQIHASVKRTDESRGANIMGNQLGYLY